MHNKISSYIVKLTGGCNLGCPYCYYFAGTPRIAGSHLDIGLILKLMDQASERSEQVELIWHGGEPLMVGIKAFEQIIAYQSYVTSRSGTHFRNLIQTNATLLNARWIELFHDSDFGIGVSLDGPEWLHNTSRPYVSGRGSFQQTMRGVELLQSSNIPFSVLSVVSKHSLPHVDDIIDFFLGFQIKSFDFLPMVEIKMQKEGGVTLMEESLEGGQFAEFMNRVFDRWYELDDPTIRVRYLDNVLIGLLGGRPSTCKFNGSCGEYVTLNHDGTMLPCDNFIGNNELIFGNLGENPLDELLDGRIRTEFRDRVSETRTECSDCQFLSACRGGCSKYSYMWNQSFQDPNYFCGDRWQVFTHISGRLKSVGVNLSRIQTEPLSAVLPVHSVAVSAPALKVAQSQNGKSKLPDSSDKRVINSLLNRLRKGDSRSWNDWGQGYDAWDRS